MRVFVAGIDGYLGWPLAMRMAAHGHTVVGADDYRRRSRVAKASGGHDSALPIASLKDRLAVFKQETGSDITTHFGDMTDADFVQKILKEYEPEVIYHFAEMPSAPWSMANLEQCIQTSHDNLDSTLILLWGMREICPKSHLVKVGCYDDKTEVLTERGWLKFADLQDTDRVCCLEPDTEEIRYHEPEHIVRYPYTGPMLKVHTKSIDSVVTPNHRVVYRRQKGKPIQITHANELPDIHLTFARGGTWRGSSPATFVLPSVHVTKGAGKHEIPDKEVPVKAWLQYLGLWLSNGCVKYAQDGRPIEAVITVKKDRKKEALRRAAAALEGHIHIAEYPATQPEYTVFSIGAVQVAHYLSRFGTARSKYIPREVLQYNTDLLETLYQSLIEENDARSEHITEYFFSSSRQLLDDVQELCMKTGRVAKLCTYKREGRHEEHLSIGKQNVDTTVSKKRQKWIPYDGEVFCCTVPTGIIMTRRNGCTCWSGNTMGEYGTPDVPIPEGWFDLEYRGRKTRAQFPRSPGSFYHATKVADSINIEFACRAWGLTSTDIMQGVVYGCQTDEMTRPELRTRFDIDETWGTAINRFCAQAAMGWPITPYGVGQQQRGFLPLTDAIQCFQLAGENPPELGDYRTINQFDEVYTICDLADLVADVARSAGYTPLVKHIDNPRVEAEKHYYNPDRAILPSLGYKPHGNMQDVLLGVLSEIAAHTERVAAFEEIINPLTKWR